MVLDNKTKKILKIFCLVFFVAILTGCTQNLDSNGNLIESRAITTSTPWTLSAGWFDFLFVIPLAKGILFINEYVGNVAFYFGETRTCGNWCYNHRKLNYITNYD